MRRFAAAMALAPPDVGRLTELLRALLRRLARCARIERRRRSPATWQRLENPEKFRVA